MGNYTVTGPFTNGGAPGINQTFLNNMENFIQQLEGDAGSVVLNGGTSGTATLYQVVQGTFKYTLIVLNNFRTAGAAQQITLPTAYTFGAYIRTSEGESMSVRSGGSDQTVRVMTGFPGAVGNIGVTGTGAVFSGWNFVHVVTGFNQYNFGASWGAARTGFVIIEGS